MANTKIEQMARVLVDQLKVRDHETYNECLDDETWQLVKQLDAALNAKLGIEEPVEPEAEWAIYCKTCAQSRFFVRRDNAKLAVKEHRQGYPGHDVRFISIPRD